MAISTAHVQMAKILEMEKETHWLENANLPPDEIQRRWALKSAPLTLVLGVGAPTQPVDLDSSTANSAPPATTAVSNPPIPVHGRVRLSADPGIRHGTSPNQKTSNVTPQPMTKKRSSQSGHGPFINTETAVPPLTLNTWRASHDEPFNVFAPASSSPPAFKTRRTATGRLPAQTSDYPSISVYDPAEYVKQSQPTLSPTSPRYVRSRRGSSQNLSPTSCLSQSPSTSISDGLTNPTTLSSIGMSRSDSLGGSSFCGGFDMLKVDSQMSETVFRPNFKANETPHTPDAIPSPLSAPVQTTDIPLSLSHTGALINDAGLSSDPHLPETLRSTLDCDGAFPMLRQVSSESIDPPKSRVSRRSQEQLALSARPIAPKDFAESMSRQQSSSSSSGSEMARQVSADGLKVAITKAKYQRPTHEKIKCRLCNIKPDGYRGPHELRRHVENKHGETRKVWVCIDRSPDQKFLSNCKQCREKKLYGAYYNAACHLRRIHWNPREKGKKADKSGKGRGGNGGGDFPPMDTLKLWMEEINVPVTKNVSTIEDEEGEEEAEEDEENIPADTNFNPLQDQVNYATYKTRPIEPEVASNSENPTTAAPYTASHHQQHLTPTYDGECGQADFSIADVFPTFLPSTHNDTVVTSSFSLVVDSASSQVGAPATSTTPASAAPDHYFNETTQSTSVTDCLAFGNFRSTDMSFTSSMNSPLDPLDQFSPLLFESDPDFP